MRLCSWIIYLMANFGGVMALAYIPPPQMILERVIENAGSGFYTIEQEVQLQTGADLINIRETWLVDSDRSMKLVASAGKSEKYQFKLVYLYKDGNKYWVEPRSPEGGKEGINKSSTLDADFFARVPHFRSANAIGGFLAQLQIKTSDPIRLSRTGGVINYALGVPAPNEKSESPGLWIEQDQFFIRKIKSPSGAEWTGENFVGHGKGLAYPARQTIRWGNQTASIRTISVRGRVNPYSANSAGHKNEISSDISGNLEVSEFYHRFR